MKKHTVSEQPTNILQNKRESCARKTACYRKTADQKGRTRGRRTTSMQLLALPTIAGSG